MSHSAAAEVFVLADEAVQWKATGARAAFNLFLQKTSDSSQ